MGAYRTNGKTAHNCRNKRLPIFISPPLSQWWELSKVFALFLVHSRGPVKELVALAKSKPGQLNYGSAGNGSVAHFSAEQFKALAGVNLVHVPYKGSGPSVTDLVAGRLHLIIENLPVTLPHVRAGRL
ncbi:MAG: ABC transporter substrate-binding protein, partial [Betaproteobacteria bacterium]|nr:ABC transporter substrate-binding protein [Betaproteobacteria bacterium]